MFEKIYSCLAKIRTCRSAPLADERRRYLRYCADRGVAKSTLRKISAHQMNLVRILGLKSGQRVSPAQIETAADQWSRSKYHWHGRSASPDAVRYFVGHVNRWLSHIGRLEVPEQVRHDHDAEVAAYARWMVNQRGLSKSTVKGSCSTVNWFFDWLQTRSIALSAVTINDIDQALGCLAHGVKRYRRGTLQTYVRRLCGFFRFAEQQGWCRAGLAGGISPPKVFVEESIPAGPSRETVLQLLAAAEGASPADIRDRAVLLLLITYGLRSSEVINLQLDDIDFREKTLQVRYQKTGTAGMCPLSRGVEQSLVRYLRGVRPAGHGRSVFLTLRAPLRPLGERSVYAIVSRLQRQAGITGQRLGPHSLRHATAQRLLDQGLSMKTIGDYLGHQDIKSTSVYAKVDLKALREVAEVDFGGGLLS